MLDLRGAFARRGDMTSSVLPIILCLISAVTVAATNTFVKKGGDVLSTRMIVSIAMALSVLPFAPFVPMPTAEVWAALAVSVVVHWGYQFAMIRALHRGDLSLVFPVMRGLSPLLTAVTASIFLAEAPSVLGWAGLLIATAALIVFAMPEDLESGQKKLVFKLNKLSSLHTNGLLIERTQLHFQLAFRQLTSYLDKYFSSAY